MTLSPIASFAGAIPASQIPKRSTRQVDLSIQTERESLAKSKDRAVTQRNWLIFRAATLWDGDQRDRAETLALKLKKQPGQVVARLKTTYHGCLFLMERWAYLISKVSSDKFGGELSSANRVKALCLLGIPPDEWDDDESVISTDMISREDKDWHLQAQNHLKAIFTRERNRLVDLSKVLEAHNKEIQAKAMLGEFFDSEVTLNKAEREVARGERQLKALEKERLSAVHDEPEDEPDHPQDPASSEPTAADPTFQPNPLR